MHTKKKQKSWFIPLFLLTCLLCASYAAAQDKDTPQPPIKRGAEQVSSIFDDQAEEFEESTYTPPADIEEKIKSIPPIPENIKKHLKDKYVQIDDFIISTLQQTPYGPSGKINIGGDIVSKTADGVPVKSVIAETGRKERARAIARAIIAEEVSLLGITDMDELKEVNSVDRAEGVSIYFQRYIGALPFEYGDVAVHFKADGETIMSLQANVVAPSPELYQAAAKKTLGRGKLFRIIRQDIKTASGKADVEVGISSAQKVAIPKPPYVVWKVRAGMQFIGWDYTIDAFTGDILEKQDARRF